MPSVVGRMFHRGPESRDAALRLDASMYRLACVLRDALPEHRKQAADGVIDSILASVREEGGPEVFTCPHCCRLDKNPIIVICPNCGGNVADKPEPWRSSL